MSHEAFMRRAIALSRQQMLATGDPPFAALVVKDGRIVGEGVNRVVSAHDASAHGEVEAIRDAGRRLGSWDLGGCILYTSCEPCQMCLAAMHWAGIARLYYANSLDDCAALGFDLAPLRALLGQPASDGRLAGERILDAEAHAVFDEWRTHPAFTTLGS